MAGFYENITVSAAVPNAAADAEAAKDAAVTAKNEAEAAKDAAEIAKNLAEQHKDTASGYVGTVSGAQSIADANVASTAGDKQAAEDARDLALQYRNTAQSASTAATNAVGQVSANAATVAGMSSKIDAVYDVRTDITDVANNLTGSNTIGTVAPYVNQINTVSGITTEIVAVNADAPDIGTVATDLTGSNNIGTVAGLAPKINTVAGLSSELTTVHGNNADITTVANSLNAGNVIANVSSSIGNVNNVGNKLAEIEAVKNALSDIAAVENKLTEIDSVSDSITNVETVAGVISEVQTVAGVSDEVKNLSASTGNMATLVSKLDQTTDLAGAVTDAQNSATSASSSASTATTQATTASGHATTAATHAANLGSVAYQNLTAIAESKAVTAVDVFVYDTSKDSDGGAWRNRTQGTSWYNEALNTSTRGATKKFPAVAVIVAESSKVTIYDGDDPSMPMWMVFERTSFGSSSRPVTAASFSNGALVYTTKDGSANSGGVYEWNFISEKAHLFNWYNNAYRLDNAFPYRGANRDGISVVDNSRGKVIQQNCNDIAMTVLPNAPIDPDTGLPVPTIAVATEGGVSVIKDDGSVVSKSSNLSNYNHHECDNIVFDGEDIVFNIWNNTAYHSVARWDYELTTLKSVYSTYSSIAPSDTVIKLPSGISGNGSSGKDVVTSGDNTSLAYGSFVVNVNETTGKPKESLVNVINSSYNTGWMNGDIKLATLMDTTAENISAPELVTNGDFSSFGNNLITNGEFPNNADGWTLGSNFTWDSSGRIERTSGTGNSSFSQSINIVAGKTYRVRYDVVHTGGNNPVTNQYSAWTGVNANHNTTLSGSGSVDVYITATVTGSIPFNLYGIGDFRGYWDNVVIEEVTGWFSNSGDSTSGLPSLEVNSSGQLEILSQADDYGGARQYVNLTKGKTYNLKLTVVSCTNPAQIRLGLGTASSSFSGSPSDIANSGDIGIGTHNITFVCGVEGSGVHLYIGGRNDITSLVVDNISLTKAEPDRSVNNNGLNIVGNVTKSAVATGAELVGYSTSGNVNNYMKQPDHLIDYTTDWFVSMWSPTSQFYFSIWDDEDSTQSGYSQIASSLYTANDGIIYYRSKTLNFDLGSLRPKHIAIKHVSGEGLYIYLDGVLYTFSTSLNTTISSARLYIGRRTYDGNPSVGGKCNMALFKLSATCPTDEQIAKIYRDEKPLFQEGAKCTLVTTDNVNAIAYDEGTELLHVGNTSSTASTRDVFSGLQRVESVNRGEYHTNIAISAVNGLVVEE